MNLIDLLTMGLESLTNDEAIKIAPEGSPEHTVFNATGKNPFDLLEKVLKLQEETSVPENNEEAILNTKKLIGQMTESFTGDELATLAIYTMLNITTEE